MFANLLKPKRTSLAMTAALAVVLFVMPASAVTLVERNIVSLGADVDELSGLTFVSGDEWLAISDDDNLLAELDISLNLGDASINAASVVLPTDTLGGTIRDYEGIAYTDPVRGTVFVSEEGTPAVREFSLTSFAEEAASPYTTPTIFSGNTLANRGFESLTLNPAGDRLYTANEESLSGDGNPPTDATGGPVRIVEYTVAGASVTPGNQYAYPVDPTHGPNGPGAAGTLRSGLSDLVALPDGNLLALERSIHFTDFLGNDLPDFQLRIYYVDLMSGIPIGDISLGLEFQAFTPLSKTLLWTKDTNAGALELPFNLEGLALGPATAGGWSVLGITDNQSAVIPVVGTPIPSELIAFELITIPEPSTFILALLTLLGLATQSRRRRTPL